MIGPPIQRGEGWASFFGVLAKRFLPAAARGIKAIAKSNLVKDVGNTLMQQGVNAATDIISNVIEGKENPLDEAKNRLQETRKVIADTIRKRKFPVSDELVTDKSVSNEVPKPQNKRKRNSKKARKRRNTIFLMICSSV